MILFGQKWPFAQVRAAHKYGPIEVAPRRLGQYVYGDAGGARFVSHQSDVRSVAVKVGDIFVNELQRQSLIVKSEISRRTFTLRTQKS